MGIIARESKKYKAANEYMEKKIQEEKINSRTDSRKKVTIKCSECLRPIVGFVWHLNNKAYCLECYNRKMAIIQQNAGGEEVRKNHFRNEAEEAGYQAYMDYARGSLTPEEAYTNRGFVKDKDGKWMYGKLLEKDDTPHNSPEELHPTIFKMITKEGQTHSFTYLGQNRYSPNRSSTCGYGSDDWFYLCEENNTYYLLIFTDNASFGTDWMCVELLEDDYEKLVTKDINFWGSIAYSRERNQTYGMHLTDVNSVRHLLPTVSRCSGKLTDEHF